MVVWVRMAPIGSHLDAWSTAGGAVWEGLGGVACWRWCVIREGLWGFKRPSHFLLVFCLMLWIRCSLSYCSGVMPACHAPQYDGVTVWNDPEKLLQAALVMTSYHSNMKGRDHGNLSLQHRFALRESRRVKVRERCSVECWKGYLSESLLYTL